MRIAAGVPVLRIGQEDAQRIADAFDVSPEFLLNLERAYLRNPDTKDTQ